MARPTTHDAIGAFVAALGLAAMCWSCTGTTSETEANTPAEGGAGATQSVGGAVELSGAYNARQTGGITTSEGQQVRELTLIRAGQLDALGTEGCAELQSLGIRTVRTKTTLPLRATTISASSESRSISTVSPLVVGCFLLARYKAAAANGRSAMRLTFKSGASQIS